MKVSLRSRGELSFTFDCFAGWLCLWKDEDFRRAAIAGGGRVQGLSVPVAGRLCGLTSWQAESCVSL